MYVQQQLSVLKMPTGGDTQSETVLRFFFEFGVERLGCAA